MDAHQLGKLHLQTDYVFENGTPTAGASRLARQGEYCLRQLLANAVIAASRVAS
jgi:hypothetical protein